MSPTLVHDALPPSSPCACRTKWELLASSDFPNSFPSTAHPSWTWLPRPHFTPGSIHSRLPWIRGCPDFGIQVGSHCPATLCSSASPLIRTAFVPPHTACAWHSALCDRFLFVTLPNVTHVPSSPQALAKKPLLEDPQVYLYGLLASLLAVSVSVLSHQTSLG